MNLMFKVSEGDFDQSARCQVKPYVVEVWSTLKGSVASL